jgi:hypothetical protein
MQLLRRLDSLHGSTPHRGAGSFARLATGGGSPDDWVHDYNVTTTPGQSTRKHASAWNISAGQRQHWRPSMNGGKHQDGFLVRRFRVRVRVAHQSREVRTALGGAADRARSSWATFGQLLESGCHARRPSHGLALPLPSALPPVTVMPPYPRWLYGSAAPRRIGESLSESRGIERPRRRSILQLSDLRREPASHPNEILRHTLSPKPLFDARNGY